LGVLAICALAFEELFSFERQGGEQTLQSRGSASLEIYPNSQQIIAGKTGLRRVVWKAFGFIPRHAYLPFLHELGVAMRLRASRTKRVRLLFEQQRDLLVNLGCGECGKPGWVNVDVQRYQGVNCLYDCRTSLPFCDNSVRGIFTEHFFEHLDYTEEAPAFISECYRVLKPGGVLRIIVPDAEKYMRAYCSEGWDELARVRPLRPDLSDVYFESRYHTKMEVVNAVFRQYFEHKFAYDFATLDFLIRRCGFQEVIKQEFGKSLRPELLIDQLSRASESLYVEAVKWP
jgi:predicted SAM-dependent methyltransferase